jgi:hypothetical protein
MLFEVGVEVLLAESDELAYSDEADTALGDQPPHQPRGDSEALRGGFDGPAWPVAATRRQPGGTPGLPPRSPQTSSTGCAATERAIPSLPTPLLGCLAPFDERVAAGSAAAVGAAVAPGQAPSRPGDHARDGSILSRYQRRYAFSGSHLPRLPSPGSHEPSTKKRAP